MELLEATWVEVADTDADVGVVPVGSCEQHGPHAPLGTDTITADAVTDAGVDAYDGEAIVTPTVPVGVSDEHRQFPGTLSLSPSTFRGVVGDIIESLARHDITRVVVVNGHGGNVGPLREVCARVSREEVAYAVPFTWFDTIDDEMGHAGPVETALLRHVRPELVRDDELEGAATEAADRWGTWVGSTNVAHDAIEFTGNGVVGDPRSGDRETGERHRRTAGSALASVLAHVADRDWPPPSSPA